MKRFSPPLSESEILKVTVRQWQEGLPGEGGLRGGVWQGLWPLLPGAPAPRPPGPPGRALPALSAWPLSALQGRRKGAQCRVCGGAAERGGDRAAEGGRPAWP